MTEIFDWSWVVAVKLWLGVGGDSKNMARHRWSWMVAQFSNTRHGFQGFLRVGREKREFSLPPTLTPFLKQSEACFLEPESLYSIQLIK